MGVDENSVRNKNGLKHKLGLEEGNSQLVASKSKKNSDLKESGFLEQKTANFKITLSPKSSEKIE